MEDRALLVAINAYPDPRNALRGCLNDAIDLRTEALLACGFEAANIEILRDAAATAAHWRTGLAWLTDPSITGRRFMAYSGHGAQMIDGDTASDVCCPWDFAWSHETALTIADFRAAFERLPPDGPAALWLSDSCHSGGLAGDATRAPSRNDSRPRAFVFDRQVRVHGHHSLHAAVEGLPHVALISGCRSDQTSADALIGGRYNGAFTHALLQALRIPGALDRPLTWVVAETIWRLKADGYDQVPQLTASDDQRDRPFLDPGSGVCQVEGAT